MTLNSKKNHSAEERIDIHPLSHLPPRIPFVQIRNSLQRDMCRSNCCCKEIQHVSSIKRHRSTKFLQIQKRIYCWFQRNLLLAERTCCGVLSIWFCAESVRERNINRRTQIPHLLWLCKRNASMFFIRNTLLHKFVWYLLRLIFFYFLFVQFLHSKDIIHRDLKPDNLLLISLSTDREDVRAKLSDFGTAKDSLQQTTTMSQTGTPVFMPPEVWFLNKG